MASIASTFKWSMEYIERKDEEACIMQAKKIFQMIFRRYAPKELSWERAEIFFDNTIVRKCPHLDYLWYYTDICHDMMRYWKGKRKLQKMELKDDFPVLPKIKRSTKDILHIIWDMEEIIISENNKKMISALAEEHKFLEMEIDGYEFVIPKNMEEIKTESDYMQNCMYSRAKKGEYAANRWYYVFVRRTESPDEPFADLLFSKNDSSHENMEPAFLIYRYHEYIDPRDEFSKTLMKWYQKINNREMKWKKYQMNNRHF